MIVQTLFMLAICLSVSHGGKTPAVLKLDLTKSQLATEIKKGHVFSDKERKQLKNFLSNQDVETVLGLKDIAREMRENTIKVMSKDGQPIDASFLADNFNIGITEVTKTDGSSIPLDKLTENDLPQIQTMNTDWQIGFKQLGKKRSKKDTDILGGLERLAGYHLLGRGLKANNMGLWIIYPVTEGQRENLFRMEFKNVGSVDEPLLTVSLKKVKTPAPGDLAVGTAVQLRKISDPPLVATARVLKG